MTTTRTQVGIIGAGPSGLLLAHLLHLHGISSILIESQTREYCEARIRAGLLEQGTVETLIEAGVGDRLKKEGLPHHGVQFSFGGKRHRIDLSELTGGRQVTIYGQHEVVRDLIAARLADNGDLRFSVSDAAIHDIETSKPRITYRDQSGTHVIECDFIAGCDGFHGICRPGIPAGILTAYDRKYPFAWLGILAQAPIACEELVYARHANGFALATMRSTDVTRMYLQCEPDEDLSQWSDDRIWSELHTRLEQSGDLKINEGKILQKGVTAMRSYVVEPMQHGQLFLVGDAAHIVPPTGAKGMNLAVADVRVLARGLEAYFKKSNRDPLDRYSATCLARIWKSQRFSWWMTTLLHRFPDTEGFDAKVQLAELDYVMGSRAASTALAENYVGLPLAV